MEYTTAQKCILRDSIESITDNTILNKIIKIIKKNNTTLPIKIVDSETICRFNNLTNETYLEIENLINEYNTTKQIILYDDLECSSGSEFKLKNSQKRILNKHNYQKVLKQTIQEIKKE